MENITNILITGVPGVGKTTLITRLCDALKESTVAGFFTIEIREEGMRKGFKLIGLDGREALLSHVEIRSRFRVGKYGVDVRGFEEFLDAIDLEGSSAAIIVIDEIGKMECYSAKFRQLIGCLQDSRKIVIATIAIKGDGFISQIKQRPDAQLFEMTSGNRDSLVSDVMGQVERILRQGKG